MKNGKLRIWELSLLFALCTALCFGAAEQARLQRLEENVVRLHVIAVSDADSEQALKLRVRDAVEAYIAPGLAGCRTAEEARALLLGELGGIRGAALSASEGREVAVKFGEESYGERRGDGYTLPAGRYASLRVVIGAGEGHNWWGVIFPQLTAGSCGGYEDAVRVLGRENVRLISGGDGYQIRFRFLDWLASLS